MGFLGDILQAIGVGGGHPAPAGGQGNGLSLSDFTSAPSGGFGPASSQGLSLADFTDPYGTGGGFGGGGAQDPIAVAQQQLTKEAGYASGSPQANAAAQAVAGGHKGGGGLLGSVGHFLGHSLSDVLSGLDYPRSVAVSGVGELDAALNGKSPSLSRFESNVTHHASTGHILAGLEGPKSAQSHAGRLNNSILGIIGDATLDPLTYVGGLGESVKALDAAHGAIEATAKAAQLESDARKAEAAASGARSAGKLIEQADGSFLPEHTVQASSARALADEANAAAEKVNPNGVVTHDTFGRLMTQGPAGLFREERAALGVKTGVGIRKLQAPILSGKFTDPISRAAHEMGASIRARGAMSSLAKKIMPHPAVSRAMHEALQEGRFSDAYHLAAPVRAASLIPGVRTRFVNAHAEGIQKVFDKLDPSMHASVRQALDTGTGPAVGHEATTALRSSLNGIKDDLANRGVEMGSIEHYLPHQVTDAAKAAQAGPRKGLGGRLSAELQRTLKPGDYFLGHKLQQGSVDEINSIMAEEGHPDLFHADLPSIMDTYLHGAANRAAMQEYAKRLSDMGVTHTGDAIADPKEWERMLNSGAFSNYGNKMFSGDLKQSHLATEPIPAHRRGDAVHQALTRMGLSDQSGDVKLAASGAFKDRYAPQPVQEALQHLADERRTTALNQPGFTGKKIDSLLGTWRKLALAMPGKAMRHMFAQPAWAHYIGQVSPSMELPAGRAWRQYVKGGLDAVTDPSQRKWIDEEQNLGIQHGHQFGHNNSIATEDIGKGAKIKAKASAANRYNPAKIYFDKNSEMQARVQDWARHIMFADARNKGLSDLAAAEKVRSLMGNPGALTDFEKNVARRAVPFYAFLRTMMPAQVKALAHTPNKFLNVVNAQNEVAGTQQKPPLIPGYFADELLNQTPLHSGANPLFMTPDLPFTRMNTTISQPFSELNPLLQVILEQHDNANPMTGAQFSPSDKPLPGVLQAIAPLLNHLGAYKTVADQTDFGVTTPAGTEKISARRLNELQNIFPTISQAIDLFNGNTKTGGGTAGDITNLLGVVRAAQDSPTQQASVLWDRYFAIQKLIKQAQNKGELPSYIRGYKAP